MRWALLPGSIPATRSNLLAGIPLFVVQGTRDRIVPEPSTRAWLARAARAGARIDSTLIDGAGHAMLRYFRRWHRLASDGVTTVLAAAKQPVSRS